MKGVYIAVVILVICAAISYSFEDLTGFLIKAEPTTITLTPTTITAGQSITLFIKTGRSGARNYLTVHKSPSGLRRGITKWCTNQGTWLSDKYSVSFKCKGIKTLNYKTSTSWPPGTYYIRLYDYTIDDYITELFEII